MIVAVPKFNEVVAPCFEAAKTFLIVGIEGGVRTSGEVVECLGCEGFGRLQLLRDRKAGVVICDGIKGFYRDILQAAGTSVISHVSGSIDGALESFARGELRPDAETVEPVDLREVVPLADLICWTRELFTAHGYRVLRGDDVASFPVDLVAEIDCPVCGKQVRVAVCCGAHTYRPDQEISLFYGASAGYNARVYVRPATPLIEQCCEDYRIDLIDPDSHLFARDRQQSGRLPLLQTAVAGHERAFSAGRKRRM